MEDNIKFSTKGEISGSLMFTNNNDYNLLSVYSMHGYPNNISIAPTKNNKERSMSMNYGNLSITTYIFSRIIDSTNACLHVKIDNYKNRSDFKIVKFIVSDHKDLDSKTDKVYCIGPDELSILINTLQEMQDYCNEYNQGVIVNEPLRYID